MSMSTGFQGGSLAGSQDARRSKTRRCLAMGAVAAALSGVLAGCAAVEPEFVSVTASPVPKTTPPLDETSRIEAITVAREMIVEPVGNLVAAAEGLASAVGTWESTPGADLAGTTRDPRLATSAALAAAEGVLEPASSPEVAATAAAVNAIMEAITNQRAAVDQLVALDERVRIVDRKLDEFRDEYDGTGDRSDQRERFTQLAEDAEALRDELADELADAPCPEVIETRRAAAAHVMEVAPVLADHATEGRGQSFDELREQLDKDPWGNGSADLSALPGPRDCAMVDQIRAVPAELGPLLAAIEEALNPPDLVSLAES